MKPIAYQKIREGDKIKAEYRKKVKWMGVEWDCCYFKCLGIAKDDGSHVLVTEGSHVLVTEYFINYKDDNFLRCNRSKEPKYVKCLKNLKVYKFFKLTDEEWHSIKSEAVLDILGTGGDNAKED